MESGCPGWVETYGNEPSGQMLGRAVLKYNLRRGYELGVGVFDGLLPYNSDGYPKGHTGALGRSWWQVADLAMSQGGLRPLMQ